MEKINIFAVNEMDLVEKFVSEEYCEPKRSTWDIVEKQKNEKPFIEQLDSRTGIVSTRGEDEPEKPKSIQNFEKIQLKSKNLKEIELYDFEKTFDENFNNGEKKKYILVEVEGKDNFSVINSSNLPTPHSKIIIDVETVEKHSSMEFALVDYDTLFGTRFTTFIKYNSDFFACDERVIFEGLLIKLKAFDFRPFYWSKEVIFKETGIRKDRATKIISRFIELGIISTEIRKSVVSNRPQQITYFTIYPEKVLELLPKIFEGREEMYIVENDLEKYLKPIYKRSNSQELM